jgi:DNA-binding transcriptional LysR family regulator
VSLDDEATLDRLLAEQGLGPRRVTVTVPYGTLIPSFVATSNLVAIVSRVVAEWMSHAFPLVLRDLPYPSLELRSYAVWHIHQDSQPAHRWLRRLLAEVASSHPF